MAIPPWGDHRTKIDGAEFERVVAGILEATGRGLLGFRIERQEPVRTHDGLYRIDMTVRFTQLGVDFLVLVECKDHMRPVEREDIQVLADKMRAAAAQKAILFATNGFQKGAIEYAKSHGIALVRVLEGNLTYETKSFDPSGHCPMPPSWANIPLFVGHCVSLEDDGSVRTALVEGGRPEPLVEFLIST